VNVGVFVGRDNEGEYVSPYSLGERVGFELADGLILGLYVYPTTVGDLVGVTLGM